MQHDPSYPGGEGGYPPHMGGDNVMFHILIVISTTITKDQEIMKGTAISTRMEVECLMRTTRMIISIGMMRSNR